MTVSESEPRISVCIPTHDRHRLLKKAIGSVLQSTEQRFEIVISDDVGSEVTRQLVQSFSDDRLRYIRFQTDEPDMTSNWSNALRKAKAPYVFKLDDDDEIEPGFLELTCDFLDQHSKVTIVFTAFTFFIPGREPVTRLDHQYFTEDVVDGFTYGTDILLNRAYPLNHKSAGVFRREAAERIGYFDKVRDDILFTVAMGVLGDIGYIPTSLFRYKMGTPGQQGMTTAPLRRLFEGVHAFFELDDVRCRPKWTVLQTQAIRVFTLGCSIRYIAEAFSKEGWAQGWVMANFARTKEPFLNRSLFFWLATLLFSIMPAWTHNALLKHYLGATWLRRLVNLLGRT